MYTASFYKALLKLSATLRLFKAIFRSNLKLSYIRMLTSGCFLISRKCFSDVKPASNFVCIWFQNSSEGCSINFQTVKFHWFRASTMPYIRLLYALLLHGLKKICVQGIIVHILNLIRKKKSETGGYSLCQRWATLTLPTIVCHGNHCYTHTVYCGSCDSIGARVPRLLIPGLYH